MAYVTQAELIKILRRRLAVRNNRQVDLAREIGVKPQNLSVVLKGAPVGGKILAWLGFEKVDGLYQKKAAPVGRKEK